MDNTLSNILFTAPMNKSDQTGLKQQEDFPEERIERYSINERLKKKEVVLC